MDFILETADIKEYLKASDMIDYENKKIKEIAGSLSKGAQNEIELTKKNWRFQSEKS